MDGINHLMVGQEELERTCESIEAYQRDLDEELDVLNAAVDKEYEQFGGQVSISGDIAILWELLLTVS